MPLNLIEETSRFRRNVDNPYFSKYRMKMCPIQNALRNTNRNRMNTFLEFENLTQNNKFEITDQQLHWLFSTLITTMTKSALKSNEL